MSRFFLLSPSRQCRPCSSLSFSPMAARTPVFLVVARRRKCDFCVHTNDRDREPIRRKEKDYRQVGSKGASVYTRIWERKEKRNDGWRRRGREREKERYSRETRRANIIVKTVSAVGVTWELFGPCNHICPPRALSLTRATLNPVVLSRFHLPLKESAFAPFFRYFFIVPPIQHGAVNLPVIYFLCFSRANIFNHFFFYLTDSVNYRCTTASFRKYVCGLLYSTTSIIHLVRIM